jgi:predicted O-methyltransferase YrrM
MRHMVRNALLMLGYAHPAALGVAFRRGPNAAKRYLSEIYRCSKTDAGLHLPTIDVEDLVSGAVEYTVVRPPSWEGSMTITEISSLCMLVAAKKPRKILEIGTFRGLTTVNLARNAPEAIVHTLDLPPDASGDGTLFDNADRRIIERRGYYHYADAPEARRIRQHHGDTATFDFSHIGGNIDLCLVDAAHSYQYVRNDTAKIAPLMSETGIILWHDYGRNDFLAARSDQWGVSSFLHELAQVGVSIIHGTSLGVLSLTPTTLGSLRRAMELPTTGLT